VPAWFVPAAVTILAGAALLRVYASLGDFWLDEIWSVNIAARIGSAAQILTSIHQENNHYLNTWLIWLIGPGAPWTVYRIPAVIAGVATVGLAGLIARGSRTESAIAMLLTGGAHLLVHYSSEARGYGFVVFFAALAFWSLDRSFTRRPAAHECIFAASCVFGVLSQPMFAYFFAAAAGWALWRWWRLRVSPAKWPAHLARAFLAPTLVVAALWAVDLRRTEDAGGPIYPIQDVAVETASRAVGGAASGPAAVLTALVVAAAFAGAVAAGRRAQDGRPVFYVFACVVAPAIVVGGLGKAMGRDEVYVRYFLIAVFFLLIALSSLLARWIDRGGLRRVAATAAVLAMLIGNATHLARLMRDGRGHYVAALTLMSEKTEGPEIVLGSDHDYQCPFVVDFYRTRIPGLKPIRYVDQSHWPAEGPEWLMRIDLAETFEPPPVIGRPGQEYKLVELFPYAGLSGWASAVYHRSD
jgi:hypothetical protein